MPPFLRLPLFLILTAALGATDAPSSVADLPGQANVAVVAGAPAALTVKRAKTGHLLVPAKIDGQDAGWFIFDTGAGMSCINRSVANKLQLRVGGETVAEGNAGSQDTHFRRAATFEFGPVRVADTLLVELELDAIGEALGEPIAGVIGYECFYAGVFEIDVVAPAIAVHPTEGFALPGAARWHEFQMIDRRPNLAAQIEDRAPTLFLLDLGSNEGVTLYAPTVKSLGLFEGRETTASQHGGVGGMQPARKGSLRSFALAGQKLADVPTTFSQATAGIFAQTQKAGAIGVQILGRFRIVLDYRNSRLALVPRT